jgi:hypothetical protein
MMTDRAEYPSALKKTIKEIQNKVKGYPSDDPNEQSIKQGIILPILRDLSWPIHDPKVVYPEYGVKGGRIDYALCDQNRPVILIEAKRYNRLDGAEWQVFQYSVHVGTPLVILTDGLEWRFFMPGEEGAYYERLLCSIHIIKGDIDEVIRYFCKYLLYTEVLSRKAIDEARQDYRKKREANSDTESKIDSITVKNTITAARVRSGKSISTSGCRFIFKGREYSAKNRQEAAAILLNKVADIDETVLARIEALPSHGQSRKYLAKSQNDIYPDNPVRSAQKTFQFRPGWYIPGGLGTRTLNKIVEMICYNTNLIEGKDIIILEK